MRVIGIQYVSPFDSARMIAESVYFECTNSWANKFVHKNSLCKLDIRYEDDYRLNACVFHESDTDYLVLNVGTVLGINEYMLAVLARPEMFIEIGNHENENHRDFKSLFIDPHNESSFIYAPSDEVRMDTARYLTYFALRYVVCHELGHLINGHSLLLNELTNSRKIYMYSAGNVVRNNVLKPLDSRTLEYDADMLQLQGGFVMS